MSALPASGELRALPLFDALPAGCCVHITDDMRHYPHIKPGEAAVVDTNDRAIIWGELYLVLQSKGPIIWQIAKPRGPWEDDGGPPAAMLHPLNSGRRMEDGSIDWRFGVNLSDGPIYLTFLAEQIIGRVIGLMAAKRALSREEVEARLAREAAQAKPARRKRRAGR